MYLVCDWIDDVRHYNLNERNLKKLKSLCARNSIQMMMCKSEDDWPDLEEIFAYVGNRPNNNLIKCQNLKWIHFGSVGVDKVDIKAARDRGIIVTNSANIFNRSVSLFCMNSIIQHCRSGFTPVPTQNFTRDIWQDVCIPFDKLNVNILGHGPIAQNLCRLLYGNQFSVSAFTRRPYNYKERYPVLDILEIEKPKNDKLNIFVNLLPLAPGTLNFCNEKLFSGFTSIDYYLNVGRDLTENTTDILNMMRSGKLRRAGWDVIRNAQKVSKISAEFGARVDFTPHIAAFNYDHWSESYGLVKKNLLALLSGNSAKMENIVLA